jgi:hypothetical protein
MTTVKMPVTVICTFVWIGFVCAISFLEAWLKFRAPGITLPLGLGIGRLVFGALNKVEWILAAFILLNMISSKEAFLKPKNAALLFPVIILLIQSFWLLPELDARAQMHIDGGNVPHSNLHFYFVGAEVIKVVCLFIFGISLFKTIK